MKILLVEDNPDDLLLARHELGQLGHVVLGAANGTEALHIYERERPDVLVTDIYMPGMDGFALTRAVQQRAAPQWQPVIFLSGHRDDDLQVKALQTGADAYIVKPVAASVLDAKLHVIQRLLTMQRQAEERAYELERHHAREEEERRIALHLLSRLVDAGKLADPAVHHWLAPAATLSGDLVVAARTPGGVLHVLLADGTGHGLAASINVLPVTPPFYRMTEKGFGIDAIARELNTKIKQFLPADRFVAATLVSVDVREGIVQVWNGGNPEPCLLDAGGHAERVFSLGHVALGILDDRDFDAALETHALGAGAQLVLCSDGLIEAENSTGQAFGHERLAMALVNATADARFDGVVSAVRSHLDGTAARDDISLVLVDCRPGHRPASPQASVVAAQPQTPGNWRFSLRLGARELRSLDVVPVLLGLVGQFDGMGATTGQLFVVLSELFNNALDHGLLRLDSRLKLQAGGMESWLTERERRLAQFDQGEVEFELEQFVEGGRSWLRIACRDSGAGFDLGQVAPSSGGDGELPFGRGIALLRSICTSVQYNEAGNVVSALLALDGAATA